MDLSPMSGRLSHLLPARVRLRAPRIRSARGIGSCVACGEPVAAADHAIQLTGGTFHAGCVLYRRRAPVEPARPAAIPDGRLQATR